MPDKLHRCVEQVMAEGYAEQNAYAICTAAIEGSARPEDVNETTWNAALEIVNMAIGIDTADLEDYPWDQCIADQMERYGDEETARKVCGMIKNKYGSMMAEGKPFSRKAALAEIETELKLKPKAEMTHRYFIFSQLSVDSLMPGKPFDGLTVVETHDMNGQPVTVKAEELATYLANTQAAIAATRSTTGEIVGLPIDAGKTGDHDKGDAGGWIVGVELAGDVIRLVPRWTELGRDLITKSIRRFFSATIDTVNKVILGGTLTNWPAVRDAQGKMLLKPIELSKSLYELATDESLDEQSLKVRQAFEDQMMPDMQMPTEMPYIREVYADHVICSMGESLYSVSYTTDADGAITFAPQTEWIEVKQSYVEAAFSFIRSLFPKSRKTGDEPMTVKLADLSEADKNTLLSQLATQLQTPPAGSGELTKLVTTLTDEARRQATLQMQAEMSRLQQANQIAELSARLVGGSPDAPRGLKNVTADDLKKHLSALPADESKFFGDLLANVVKDGLAEFKELGHGRQMDRLQPVPEFAAASLKAALAAGNTVEQFFELAGLGDPKHYDLTPFAKPANGKDK